MNVRDRARESLAEVKTHQLLVIRSGSGVLHVTSIFRKSLGALSPMSKSILSLALVLVLGFAGVSNANSGCTNCGLASAQGYAAPSAQSVVAVADCGGGCGKKGLSLPHISLPKISLPKLVHTTSCEYVMKKKHHFSLVKAPKACNDGCGAPAAYAAPAAVASPQASLQR